MSLQGGVAAAAVDATTGWRWVWLPPAEIQELRDKTRLRKAIAALLLVIDHWGGPSRQSAEFASARQCAPFVFATCSRCAPMARRTSALTLRSRERANSVSRSASARGNCADTIVLS
jgi:hypothetical protein